MKGGEETKSLAFTTVCWPIVMGVSAATKHGILGTGPKTSENYSRPVRTCEVTDTSSSFEVAFYFFVSKLLLD